MNSNICIMSGLSPTSESLMKGRPAVHGEAAALTREYRAWQGARYRCNNYDNRQWQNYGGRGIRVCKRWDDYRNFLADMGRCPPGLTLERKDVNGDYEPANCEWAAMRRQENNKRNTRRIRLGGVTRSLAEWCRHFDLPYRTIARRWETGWRGARLFLPIGQYRTRETGNKGNPNGNHIGHPQSKRTRAKIAASMRALRKREREAK